jgi:hypothetical protein
VDPLSGEYPWNSTYAFSENKALQYRELEGKEGDPAWAERHAERLIDPEYAEANLRIHESGVLAGGMVALSVGVVLGPAAIKGAAFWAAANPLSAGAYAIGGGEFLLGVFDPNPMGSVQLPGPLDDAGRGVRQAVSNYVEAAPAVSKAAAKGTINVLSRAGKSADELYAMANAARGGLKIAMEEGGNKLLGQAHHIIPLDLIQKNPYIKELYESGWDINKSLNGIELKAPFHGNHPKYTEFVGNLINTHVKRNGFEGLENYIEQDLIPTLKTEISRQYEIWKNNPQSSNTNDYFRSYMEDQ